MDAGNPWTLMVLSLAISFNKMMECRHTFRHGSRIDMDVPTDIP